MSAKPARRAGKPRKTKTNSEFFDLRLYIAGQTARSLAALANLQRICDEHLEGRYRLEVIDLLEHPQLARGDQIFGCPLGPETPRTDRRLLGDLPIPACLGRVDLRPSGRGRWQARSGAPRPRKRPRTRCIDAEATLDVIRSGA
jgi:circadian clock protein KaiB